MRYSFACLFLLALLLTPIVASAQTDHHNNVSGVTAGHQPTCIHVPDTRAGGGRICTDKQIEHGADILMHMQSPANAATWQVLPSGPTVTIVGGTPGSNSWMPWPPMRDRTRLDGTPMWMQPQQFGTPVLPIVVVRQ